MSQRTRLKQKIIKELPISQIILKRQSQDSHEASDFQASILFTKHSVPISMVQYK